jgi:hypothetical protein
MSINNYHDEERKTLLIRFIVIYVISILCIIVPMYYLFDLPNKDLNHLSGSNYPEKSELKKIARINSIMDELNSYAKENRYMKEYNYCIENLYRFLKDSVDQKNDYKSILLKISDLYEGMAKIYEEGGKVEIENLKKQLEEKDKENTDLKKELQDCTINYKVLQNQIGEQ